VKGFEITCLDCGSKNTYVSIDGDLTGGYLTVMCNNEECKQKVEKGPEPYTAKDGEEPLVGE
jgi:hypothetical protein